MFPSPDCYLLLILFLVCTLYILVFSYFDYISQRNMFPAVRMTINTLNNKWGNSNFIQNMFPLQMEIFKFEIRKAWAHLYLKKSHSKMPAC